MATHSSILAWKSPWTEEPGWLQSMGLHDWACVHEGGGSRVGSNKLVELKKKKKSQLSSWVEICLLEICIYRFWLCLLEILKLTPILLPRDSSSTVSKDNCPPSPAPTVLLPCGCRSLYRVHPPPTIWSKLCIFSGQYRFFSFTVSRMKKYLSLTDLEFHTLPFIIITFIF